jgi:hypothetical protein
MKRNVQQAMLEGDICNCKWYKKFLVNCLNYMGTISVEKFMALFSINPDQWSSYDYMIIRHK